MSTNADNLARHVLARRNELELSQLDVWQAGGPSNTTLTQIEHSKMAALSRTTARRLDVGLSWEPGSARRVWNGGEPQPLSRELDPGLVDEVMRAGFSESTREHILRALEADARTAADEGRRSS